MSELHIDFETRSCADLPVVGLDNYAKDPTTDAWCMAYAFDDDPVFIITDNQLSGHHAAVCSHVENDGLVVAHNAAFELAIWNNVMVKRYGWPELRPEQVRCTMAQCYAMSLPGGLDKASAALGVIQRKDTEGGRLMMQMAKPKSLSPLMWWDEPEKRQRLYDYCKQDVVVERDMGKRLMALSDNEQQIWVLDQKINGRGVLVDRRAVDKAMHMVNSEKNRLDKEMQRATNDMVSGCNSPSQLVKWIRSQGVAVEGATKADVAALLDDPLGLVPEPVTQVLEIRKEAAKASAAKLITMIEAASSDGRVRGTMQYHGANTGRWAGRRIQPHNLPRTAPAYAGLEGQIIEAIREGMTPAEVEMLYGPPMDAISNCLRGFFIPAAGHDFITADFANIEGRVLAWLAGEEWKLRAFREFDMGIGADIYKLSYSKSFNKEISTVTKDERQIGKVQELALGYQGGVGAFQTMARGYGVKITDARADEIKLAWRAAHPAIKAYWYEVQNAALAALDFETPVPVGPRGREVVFRKKGSFLWCKLPSGRVLCYPYPSIGTKTWPDGGTSDVLKYKCVQTNTFSWGETETYGGSLVENITQAVARDILAESLIRLEVAGYPVVLHVHDEAVCEFLSGARPEALVEVEDIMAIVPVWAKDLPVAVEGWRGPRYKK